MPSPADIAAAVTALKAGRLVILPTETVYGLAADAADPGAVARIFEAKGRPRFNPLIAHVADLAGAERIAIFDDRARALAERFWPGPLTLVLPVRDADAVCDLARAGLETVAVRMPGHPLARSSRPRPIVQAGPVPRPMPTRWRKLARRPQPPWTAAPVRSVWKARSSP
jgi:L-threonylcarbamoyladenylate synthase